MPISGRKELEDSERPVTGQNVMAKITGASLNCDGDKLFRLIRVKLSKRLEAEWSQYCGVYRRVLPGRLRDLLIQCGKALIRVQTGPRSPKTVAAFLCVDDGLKNLFDVGAAINRH